jgi:type II secretory pathway component GspD/PulD (secretin)
MKSELMIFLTPYIVETPSELASLAESEQSKSEAHKAFTEDELNHFLDALPPQPKDAKSSDSQKRSRERP